MNINDKIVMEMEVGTLATLIAGLYVSYSALNVNAIPSSMFIEIAERVAEHLPVWDYDKISFEDWIKYNLLIMPLAMFSQEELEEFRNNDLFIERKLGNATLIATAEW